MVVTNRREIVGKSQMIIMASRVGGPEQIIDSYCLIIGRSGNIRFRLKA